MLRLIIYCLVIALLISCGELFEVKPEVKILLDPDIVLKGDGNCEGGRWE